MDMHISDMCPFGTCIIPLILETVHRTHAYVELRRVGMATNCNRHTGDKSHTSDTPPCSLNVEVALLVRYSNCGMGNNLTNFLPYRLEAGLQEVIIFY